MFKNVFFKKALNIFPLIHKYDYKIELKETNTINYSNFYY
jgi:hypothetical protein